VVRYLDRMGWRIGAIGAARKRARFGNGLPSPGAARRPLPQAGEVKYVSLLPLAGEGGERSETDEGPLRGIGELHVSR
jgi:hypothetical protein